MIIFDFNQIAISNLMEQINNSSNTKVDENLVRHMILNSIRNNVKKFKSEFGSDIVIAYDNKHYWRRDVFPNYKFNRRKSREASGLDWKTIFECLNKVKQELKENSHYKIIDVHGAEADDVIATLSIKYSQKDKILILSSDKDFVQLQQNENVFQYSPMAKKFIKDPLPKLQLKQLIIRGDKGDGIPNILSEDNFIVDGIRQKPIVEVKLLKWLHQMPEEFCDDGMLKNYKRNELLIDLTMTPIEIQEKIISDYEQNNRSSKQKFMNYLISKRLKNLLEVIDEF